MLRAVQLLIRNALVVTMNASRQVLRDADIVVDGGRIAHVGPHSKASRRSAMRVIDGRGLVVTPGLIHSHLHACQTLCRNHADGLELLDWLRERIWPFEASHDAESMRASADLTFLELITSGATACLDMGSVRHYGAVFESARDAGLRLVGGKCMMDAGQGVPSGLRETTEASLAESLALLERWHGAEGGRLTYAFAPRFVLSCTETLMRRVGALARERGVRVHTHASENPTECDLVRERTGLDNVAYFHALGLLGPHTTLAHCVWVTAEEQKLLRQTGTCVCHCPSANFKLASGVAKVPELVEQGITVGLGADGAPCNNTLDIFHELRLAALMHLPRVGPTGFSAMRALELATVQGAKALGLEADIGSIEPGKKADLTFIDLSGPHLTPVSHDPVATLVYSAQSRDVRHVMVDGRLLLFNRRPQTMDAAAVRRSAVAHARRLLEQLE
ncbi:MAG: 5'-deoxyadenosine deaminase [Myxococcaceae bacterium]|nr:5'-deoxyadenosine deaminase [Myxococcaceae bacterium]MCA3016013.1 5'-deoxyadenosine deaminase [Myxococcaceae bacterium]